MKILRLGAVAALSVALNVALTTGGSHASTGTLPARHLSDGSAHTMGSITQTAKPFTTTTYPGGYPGWYEINNYDAYCTGGGTACYNGEACYFDQSYCGNLAYVDAVGPAAGATYGTPGFVSAGCYVQTSDGGFLTGGVAVETAAFSALWDGYYNSSNSYIGAIGGKGTLLSSQTNEDTEDAPQAASSLSFSAYDPTHGITVSVTGVQNTDNGSDTLNNGLMTITVRGVQSGLQSTHTGLYNSDTGLYYTGTIRCQAGGPNATALGNAFGDTYANPCFYGAEGELEDYPFHEYNNFIYYLNQGGVADCLNEIE